MKLTTIAALLSLGLCACASDQPQAGQEAREPEAAEPATRSLQSAVTAAPSIPVTVVNTAQVTGTVGLVAGTSVGVSGSVGITGTPSVQVVNVPKVTGTVTCEQSAAYETTVTNTPNVAVVAMPKVEVTGTTNVAVTNVPSVQLAGVPTVNVANFPTGGGGGGVTVVANHQLIDVPQLGFTSSLLVDVSAYREVRVILRTMNGATDWTAAVQFYDANGQELQFVESVTQDFLGELTRVYTIPGAAIRVALGGSSGGPTQVLFAVYGRS